MLVSLRERPDALDDKADPLVHRLEAMARAVRRDIHKMHAFLRFREVETEDGPRFVAWFEPDHHIVRAAAAFFVRRFANMRWSILTPELSLHWDGETLSRRARRVEGGRAGGRSGRGGLEDLLCLDLQSGPGQDRRDAEGDAEEILEKHARDRVGGGAGQGRAGAGERDGRGSAVKVGDNVGKSWAAVRAEAMHCTRCDLYKCATQTVFGEGPLDARILFVGEQPGDQEDLAGRPFVGPAGQLFDRALAEAGVDRGSAPTSPTRSSISSSSGAASAESTTSPTAARSPPAAGGSSRSWL